ncbi:MAG: transcriptional regulator, partial [Bacteroidales bacterium]|nr:transcriptional regulator [Bacteroidales bacterium]
MFNLSRDTVFAGITELKSKGIIESRQGKGYYVDSTNLLSDYNIFLLFNELNPFKEELYNA